MRDDKQRRVGAELPGDGAMQGQTAPVDAVVASECAGQRRSISAPRERGLRAATSAAFLPFGAL